MTRDEFVRAAVGLAALPLAACAAPTEPALPELPPGPRVGTGRVSRTLDEWRALLSPAAFAVLFEEWTEPAGSSPLNAEHRAGTYLCAACLQPLFHAAAKYDSGTGWPTFSRPLEDVLDYKHDFALPEPRIEYHCARCGGHQGHLFDDGPPPSGKRYCNNGLALRFVPAGEPLPEPRS